MLRKVLVSIGLIAPVLAVAASIAGWLVRTRPAPVESDAGRRPPLVETVRVEPKPVRDEMVGYGSARADRASVLAAEVAAPVLRLAEGLEEGVGVAQDELLIALDEREFAQHLARATELTAADTAALEQLSVEAENLNKLIAIAEREEKVARDEVARVAGLFESNQAAKREFDLVRLTWYRTDRELQSLKNELALLGPRRVQLEASRASRVADMELARLNVERCRVVAPFDGRVDELRTEVGERVQPGRDLLRIVALDRIEVPIELGASTRPRVREGAPCRLALESLPEVTWTGKIARLSPSADTQNRTFRAYVEVDNTRQAEPLLPGYFVTAVVEGDLIEDALLVPRIAVLDGNHVFVLNGAQAHERAVEVRRYVKDEALVTGAVRSGDRVIVTNLDKLTDGAAVDAPAGDDE